MAATRSVTPSSKPDRSGLAHWMTRVVKEAEQVHRSFDPDSVHDLRVALRRCRSIAGTLRDVDADQGWRKLRRLSRKLFRSLGELRDAQVMAEWAQKLLPEGGAVRQRMLESVEGRIQEGKARALQALEGFDEKTWQRLARVLPERSRKIPRDGLLLPFLALERWEEAMELHRRASRNRSRIAWHRLRVGLKRFRYIVENFLPRRHAEWGEDLKRFQNLLGEVHDLDVFRTALRRKGVLPDAEALAWWGARIEGERRTRLEEYRARTEGSGSVWLQWRAGLPKGRELESAVMERFSVWASSLDPDPEHAIRVTALALVLFDQFRSLNMAEVFSHFRARQILQAAALMHDAGRAKREKGHHKVSCRLIGGLRPPFGWTAEEMRRTALVARYHRGAEPQAAHKEFGQLSLGDQEQVTWLAAALRLADALDAGHDGRVQGVRVENGREALVIRARGYENHLADAIQVAQKKHLLERLCGRPVIVQGEAASAAVWQAPAAS